MIDSAFFDRPTDPVDNCNAASQSNDSKENIRLELKYFNIVVSSSVVDGGNSSSFHRVKSQRSFSG